MYITNCYIYALVELIQDFLFLISVSLATEFLQGFLKYLLSFLHLHETKVYLWWLLVKTPKDVHKEQCPRILSP